MKIIKEIAIIPDIHGRTFWKEITEKIDSFDKIVFLGDYSDAFNDIFSDEYISRENELKNYLEILEFKKSFSDKITLLLGNHDIGYLLNLRCSRQDHGSLFNTYRKSLVENINLFKLTDCVSLNDKTYFFSHAGITEKWLELIKNELNNGKTNWLDIFTKLLPQNNSAFSCSGFDNKKIKAIKNIFSDESLLKKQVLEGLFNDLLYRIIGEPAIKQFMSWCLWTVGVRRGGMEGEFGSLVWADSTEWNGEDKYFGDEITQIVGHNRLLPSCNSEFAKGVYCIDRVKPKVIYSTFPLQKA